MWHSFNVNIKIRLINSFINRLINSSLLPFIALFLAEKIGDIYAGSFLIISLFISFFGSTLGGYVSDKYYRKNIISITSFFSFLSLLFMTLSLSNNLISLYIFLICYILFIVINSISRPSIQALVLDISNENNRKSIYTYDYWLTNLAMAIGVTLGGLFFKDYQIYLFIFLTISAFIVYITYKFGLQKYEQTFSNNYSNGILSNLLRQYKEAFKDRNYMLLILSSIFIFVAEFSLNSYVAIRLSKEFSIVKIFNLNIDGIKMLSILNILNTITVLLLTFFIFRLTKKLSQKKLLFFGITIYAIGYSIITFSNNIIVLSLCIIIAATGEIIYAPIKNTIQANITPTNQRGSYSAMNSLSFTISELISKLFIIIGAFLSPFSMSLLILILIFLGMVSLYFSIKNIKV